MSTTTTVQHTTTSTQYRGKKEDIGKISSHDQSVLENVLYCNIQFVIFVLRGVSKKEGQPASYQASACYVSLFIKDYFFKCTTSHKYL